MGSLKYYDDTSRAITCIIRNTEAMKTFYEILSWGFSEIMAGSAIPSFYKNVTYLI